jgi:hypothetical protein
MADATFYSLIAALRSDMGNIGADLAHIKAQLELLPQILTSIEETQQEIKGLVDDIKALDSGPRR